MGLCLTFVLGWTSVYAAPQNLCTLFTASEVQTLLGTAVESGETAAMGTGCQWFGKDEESFAIIQAVGPDFRLDPQQAPGYELIPNLGQRAYSHPDVEGGWRAMALTPDAAIVVVMIGETATRSNTISLIRQVQERCAKGK
ncbi:MAG: hypothetical protein IPM58_15165 [Nitrospira sp.]|nr:hypothetical protein [Nitrospira sp.]